MRATRTVTMGDRAVTVKELTVGEVRAWMVEVASGATIDPLHALALDACSLADIARMSNAELPDLENHTLSELEELVKACEALNPHFFRVRAALSGAVRTMQKEAQAQASTAPVAAS